MVKRILFVAPFPPPTTGAADMSLVLATTIEGIGDSRVDRVNVSMTRLSGSVYQYLRKVIILLIAALRLIFVRYDRLIFNPPGGAMLNAYFPLLIAARLTGVRVIADHHNYSYINKPTTWMRCTVNLLGDACTHLVLSEKMGQEFINAYPVAKVVVASNWGRKKIGDFNSVEIPDRPLTLGYLSNVTFEKGIDTFVELIQKTTERGGIVQAIVAGGLGDGVDKLLHDAQQSGLPIEVVGPVYEEAKMRFFERCDLFVFPTRYRNEAEPLVLIEAQIAGCYVLATNRGAISETVCQGNGLVYHNDTFMREAVNVVLSLHNRPYSLREDRFSRAAKARKRALSARRQWISCVESILS